MRLVSMVPAGRPRSRAAMGLVLPGGQHVVDLGLAVAVLGAVTSEGAPLNDLEWFDLDGPWPGRARTVLAACAADETRRVLSEAGALVALADVELRPPIHRPGKIVCVGLNYRDHAREARLPVPADPVIFAKFPTAVVGPDQAVVLPADCGRVDYEAELAVVIGRRARRVRSEEALDVVFGYANANDVSDRDAQKSDGQWVRSKSADTFAPIGPWIVSADEVADPHDLPIQLRLNGVVMQDSNTRELVFGVPALVEFIARTITLEPGDVVLTGTPAGVGFARRPPVYLSHGDSVEVEVGGLGVLRNHVVRESMLP